MQFSVARPDVVRAINQRWLLKFWNQHLGTHRVPRWQPVEVENLSRVAANLSILEVSAGTGPARFLVRFHGESIGQIYGSTDCRGKYLDEIIPSASHQEGLAPYRQALDTGRPVYYERLLLPYSLDGQTIDHIMASFEFVCPDGAFKLHALMKSPDAAPVLRLSATIEPLALA